MRSIGMAFSIFLIPVVFSGCAAGPQDARKITVSGKAENTVDARQAEVGLKVKIVKKEMAESHRILTTDLDGLTRELHAIGIDAKDIKRSLVLQGAEYNWERNTRVLKGYSAQCFVDVVVNDITKMADLYRTLAGHKSIEIQGTAFKRDDEFDLRKAESEKALQAARQKAEYMARALGAKVGRVRSIVEGNTGSWPVLAGDASNVATRQAGGGGTASYGTILISARVMVEFELE